MRKLAIIILALSLVACARSTPVVVRTSGTEECYLNVAYVSGNELSRRVSAHIESQQYRLLDATDGFAAALWYTPGDGRAGFVYRLNCDDARPRVQAWLERFAETAPRPDVA